MAYQPPKVHRHRFRFGLRSIFVTLTLCASVLGYEAHWVNQRRELINPREPKPSVTVTPAYARLPIGKSPVAPGLLPLFGETAYAEVVVEFPSGNFANLTPVEQAEFDRITRLFPEAKVWLTGATGAGSLKEFSTTIECTFGIGGETDE
jgi:hypothetical protein